VDLVRRERVSSPRVLGGRWIGERHDVAQDVPVGQAPLEERPQARSGVPAGLPREAACDQRIVHPVVVPLREPLDGYVSDDRQDPTARLYQS
jgi:hypothetical protein